jgi:hypothetical protein
MHFEESKDLAISIQILLGIRFFLLHVYIEVRTWFLYALASPLLAAIRSPPTINKKTLGKVK